MFTKYAVEIGDALWSALYSFSWIWLGKARSRKSGGSGLGLAIVRNMVERNQGSIRVESTFGKGSSFFVTFPTFDPDEEDDE